MNAIVERMAIKKSGDDLTNVIDDIGAEIASNGAEAEALDQYSSTNLELLKTQRFFSAMVPTSYGGGDFEYPEVATALTKLAHYHPSTALTCSMHQHVVAANRYNDSHGKPGRKVLEKVAVNESVLISTGAGDWLASNGECRVAEGGYIVSGIKHFASGSVVGDILVTSAPYDDPKDGPSVLHFPVAMSSPGVSVLDNWKAMGMRATGSNSVVLEEVFVPEEAVVARRPRGDYHAMWSVVLPIALPLIMSVYLGIAQSAAARATQRVYGNTDPAIPYLLGEMENALTMATLAVEDMVALVGNLEFVPNLGLVNDIVKRKTIAAEACKATVAKALEVTGGAGFMRSSGIENLFRDVMASHFHPLQEKRQLLFTGSLALGMEPPGQSF
ncbi:MAG: acyl-CoA dehydrogenase family protein [Pseudomonadota bacterium]